MDATRDIVSLSRWALFRLLGEPIRLRLLALAAEEELAIGELAELLRESQPNVSRHVKPMREAGLLAMRKEGTRVLVRLAEPVRADAVVAEALREGRALAEEDGSLARVPDLVRDREQPARAFFDERGGEESIVVPTELAAYLRALAPLMSHRALAVDIGTGDGRLLEALAPVFERVVAVDRSKARLATAARRARMRGYDNVELVLAELVDGHFHDLVRERGGADAVFVVRVLHHAASPSVAIQKLASILAPHGVLIVIDYASHTDESMRDEVADLWLGFSDDELVRFARDAGLADAYVDTLPSSFRGDGADAHLEWKLLVARATH